MRIIAAAVIAIQTLVTAPAIAHAVTSADSGRDQTQTGTSQAFTISKGPITAPVTIVEFSDFECPVCATMPPVLASLLALYPEQIRLVFKHSPLSIHPNAPMAHEAALAAGVQGKFWEMHDLLFANQKQLARSDLAGYAKQINLDPAAFADALSDHRLKPIVDQDLLEARAYGVTATPTFFINGQRYSGAASLAQLRAYVDAALGKKPIGAPISTEPRATRINVEGAPVRGNADAPVTIVEFSDFQCPFCRQSMPVMQQVMQAYPTQVKWIFKSFPLNIHPNARGAHVAALAASEQGKFWVMHDALFADQKNVTRDGLVATAGRLGLDVRKFTADLDNSTFAPRLEAERQEGMALGVSGTPTSFVNGRRVVGAKSFPELKAIIDQELAGRAATAEELGVVAPADAVSPLARGNSGAPITIMWFSDLRSALTPKALALVDQLMAAYPDAIKVVVKSRPLETRSDSRLAYQAALAAAAQGRFWPMHDAIVAEPPGALTRDRLVELAVRADVAAARFLKDLDGPAVKERLEADLEEARRRDIRGTPVFFINGTRIDGLQPLSSFTRLIDAQLQKR